MAKAKKKGATKEKKPAKRLRLKDILNESLEPPPKAITPPETLSEKGSSKKNKKK